MLSYVMCIYLNMYMLEIIVLSSPDPLLDISFWSHQGGKAFGSQDCPWNTKKRRFQPFFARIRCDLRQEFPVSGQNRSHLTSEHGYTTVFFGDDNDGQWLWIGSPTAIWQADKGCNTDITYVICIYIYIHTYTYIHIYIYIYVFLPWLIQCHLF